MRAAGAPRRMNGQMLRGCGSIKIAFQPQIGLRKTAICAYLIEIIDLNL
jgi:hypothetical protein